jgi:site-specific recombinase XerD
MFLRFLISQGKCPDHRYALIPTVALLGLSALPRYLQADQSEQIVASPDLVTSLGKRNRVILLLLACLGLRASDIVQVRLDDVDKREGMNRVSEKRHRQTVLPLTQEVGDAMPAYIKDHRPQADTDEVFVRSSVPYRAFADSNSISILVPRAMRTWLSVSGEVLPSELFLNARDGHMTRAGSECSLRK